MARHFTVTVTRDFEHTAETVFAAWTDPDMRRQFETPEGSGMTHKAFDTREGGTEEVIIAPEGTEIGRMIDEIRVMRPPGLIVVHGRGVFGGAVGMTMQTTFEVKPTSEGCTLTGTSQMVVLGKNPTEDDVRAGWNGMLDRFAKILPTFQNGDHK